MSLMYALALTVSIIGMVLLDRRYKLAFYDAPRRTAIVMAAAMAVFTVWDLAGISLGIFRKGASELMLDVELFPEFPVEELLFLFLLCYLSLLGYLYARRRLPE